MASSSPAGDNYETVVDLFATEARTTLPIDLRVSKLNYSVTDKPGQWWQKITNIQMPWEWLEKGKTNYILRDINFTAKSGKLMAIMGGSGSGKTSLLDVLACRTTTGEITGDVYLNSIVRTKNLLDSCAGYVRQDDRLIAQLNVKETLMFVARLKLPASFTKEMIENRVEQVIAELGLKHAAHTNIGDAHIRGLSGGERRRVSIGIQLLILPGILFLDEPTSGLDSFTANNIAKTLSLLASNKRTIIMSLHQPRFDIFNIVDTMIILSRGSIVYNGPGKEMVNYFTKLGFPCPEHTNPCDFYIDLATVDSTSSEREEVCLAVVESLHAAYKAMENKQLAKDSNREHSSTNSNDSRHSLENMSSMTETINSLSRERQENTIHNLGVAYERRGSGPRCFTQFLILFQRFMRAKMDDYQALLTHIIQAILMSLMLGMVYIDLQYNQNSVRDWFGIQFTVSVMYPFMVILGLIGTCHDERRFLYFELQDKLYSPSAFYFAKVFSDVPFHLIYVLFYCIPVYWMAGMKVDTYTCFMFYLFVSVSVFTSRCMAMMSAAIFPTYQISSFFAQALFSLFIMSAGFTLNIDNMLSGTKWISQGSYLRWGFQALCIIEIQDIEFECANYSQSCIKNGTMALETFSFGGGELWECAIGLGGTMITFLGLMYIGLRLVPQKPSNE